MVACRSLLTVFVTLAAVVRSQQCYGIDGSLLDNSYTPCNPSAKNSGCCASSDMCLSNGLCMGTQGASIGMIFSRGCTDPTGKDVACPQQCPGVPSTTSNTNTPSAWQLQTCDSGEYCCRAANSTKSCCNDPTAPQVTTPLSATLQTPSPVPTVTETPSPNSTPSALPVPVCNTQNNHAAAIVGGTLGGILGGIILGLAFTVRYMYKRERRQRRLKEHYEMQMAKTNAYRKALESSAGSARPSLSVDEVMTKSDASD